MGHSNCLDQTLSAYQLDIPIFRFLLELASRLIPLSVCLLLVEFEVSSFLFFLLSSRIFWAGCRVVRDETLRWPLRVRLGALTVYVYFLIFYSDIELLLGTKSLCDKLNHLYLGIKSYFYEPSLQDTSGRYGKPWSELRVYRALLNLINLV
jgi:hypothetical protein